MPKSKIFFLKNELSCFLDAKESFLPLRGKKKKDEESETEEKSWDCPEG